MAAAYAVLGIGNTLLRDEGLGVHLIQHLKDNYRFSPSVDLIDGGCAGLNLYFILEQYGSVIIVDALSLGYGPVGSVHIVNKNRLTGRDKFNCSAHHVDLADIFLLLQAEDAVPDDIVLVGMVPASFAYGFFLSNEVRQKFQVLEDMVIRQIMNRNIEVEKR